MKSKTEAFAVQINKKQIKSARKLVNLPEAFRALVDKITKSKTCPCCGTLLKAKK